MEEGGADAVCLSLCERTAALTRYPDLRSFEEREESHKAGGGPSQEKTRSLSGSRNKYWVGMHYY